MAAEPRVPPLPHASAEHKPARPGLDAPAYAYLARLATLHDEAAETAHLANLLGRTPWAAGALSGAGLLTFVIALRSVPSVPLGGWLAMMATSIGVTALVYKRAIEAPFDRATLRAFAKNLSLILLFSGTAWGAGVLLALPNGISVPVSIAFVAGISAVLAAILRTRDISLCFLVPATVMGASCALLRSFGGATTAGILMSGVFIAIAAALWDRIADRGIRAQLG